MAVDEGSAQQGLEELVRTRIETLRPKLLDLSRRNPLVSTRLSSGSLVRSIDELPDVIAIYLFSGERQLRLLALPPLDQDPKDEQSRKFQDALSQARLTDPEHVAGLEKLSGRDDEEVAEIERHLERSLRDRLRAQLGMEPQQTAGDVTLAQHAKNNGIAPSYELPTEEHEDGRHTDDGIQTLLLQADLERKLNSILTKAHTWAQETGINVLHAALGFLEWFDSNVSQASVAPLILLPIEIERVKTQFGNEFRLRGVGEPETNLVLAEKLKADFGIALPAFSSGSVEQYLRELSDARLPPKWKVRRQVAFGIFPSARMAMYVDLDTSQSVFDKSEIITRLLAGGASVGSLPFAEEYEVDHPEIERKVPSLVLDADSSQFSTIVDVCSGKNLAVEGPPGTGKSQTIVNVIAAAIASGKKVLFVAEKTAALNVVKSRLEAVGLGEFVLPLQADRSTREAVIGSIRNRLSMERGGGPRQLDERIDRCRSTRAQIARYLRTVSSNFEKTDYKIYDILGKFIATSDLLAALPKQFQSPKIPKLDRLTSATLETIKSIAHTIESSWKELEQGLSHWRGVRIASADRFTVDQLTELASIAGTAFHERAAAEDQIKALAYVGDEARAERALDANCMDGLIRLLPVLDARLLAAVYSSADPAQFGKFLDHCRRYRKAAAALSPVLADPVDASIPERLRRLSRLCNDWKIPTLNSVTHLSWLDELGDLLAADKGALATVANFVESFPVARAIPISYWSNAKTIVDSYDRHVLALRTDQIAEIGIFRLVRELAEAGQSLREEKNRLAALVSVEASATTAELRNHAGALRTKSWLSFLAPSYRAAKAFYSARSKSSDFASQEAARQLDELAKLRDAIEEFEQREQSRNLFGLHFRGIETDFAQFLKAVSFFEAVEDAFPGVQNRDVRTFLKFGSVEALQSIPDVPGSAPGCTFEVLGQRIRQREAELAVRQQTIEEVAHLAKVLINPEKLPVDQIPRLAELVDELLALKSLLDGHETARLLLQSEFRGAETDADRHRPVVEAVELLQSRPEAASAILSLLSDGKLEAASAALRRANKADEFSVSAIDALSEASGIDFGARLVCRMPAEISRMLGEASQDSTGVFQNARHANACADLNEYGLSWVVDALCEQGQPLDNVAAIVEAVIFRGMALKARELHGNGLFRYSGAELNERRREFAELDREIIKLSRQDLRAKAHRASKPPEGIGAGKKSTWTEMALILNETSKKKRFIPVRDLTRRAGAALLELKPCWMMSPLAVAQYLPRGGLKFDLCIIDEASQMPPEDAIGALVRCNQAMVVGDTNQLPPTSFFKKLLDDAKGEDDDETVLEESILEIANGAFRPGRRLRWHYRSRHSGLIQFSNKYVYDGDLIIFPSASEDQPGMGVSMVPVQGRYKGSVNPDEAAAMVQAILKFMRTDPDRSLGVVTLNQPQRDLLEEEMNTALEQDTSAAKYVADWKTRNDGLESFFIKNLENVQGDERDVIFIGTVYGPSELGGPVMQRFGPITGVAGKRRLNVLFSRAKQRIVTFASMTAADIRADENSNAGVFLLKRWLEYSATGIIESGSTTNREPDSEFEVYVANQVRAMGCTAVPQVGASGYFIDIGVRHPAWPHGFIMGIECDGAAYHSSRSARDRDRLREEVLTRLGWRLHRIWSTDWFNDPRAQAERLREAIDARIEELKNQMPLAPIQSGDDAELDGMEDIPASETAELVPADVDQPVDAEVKNGSEESPTSRIEIGDTVSIRFLSGTQSSLKVILSQERNDPKAGLVHATEPLGEALVGAEEGDEIEVLVGSTIRKALIESVEKGIRHPARASLHKTQRELSASNNTDLFGNRRSVSRSVETEEAPDLFVNKSLDPARFYESDYRPVLQRLALDYIDHFGPLTFKHLGDLVARAHGFQRTGSAIQKQVWAAVGRSRQYSKPPAGSTIFWPKGTKPVEIATFRGMTINGQVRTWAEVPYPEKIGLATDTLRRNKSGDPVAVIAGKIGIARLRESTRTELQSLIVAAQNQLDCEP